MEWVAGAAASQEELQTATAATARAIGEATAALDKGSTSTERFQANIKDLQTELGSVNEALAAKRQRLSELAETITSKAHPSYQQLERQVTSLEGEAAKLTAQIGKTQASLDGQTKSTQATTAATKEAAVEIITYAEAIRQVQANIAAYVEEQALFADFGDFWRVASGQVEGYSTAIDLATASVVNHQTELETLLNAGFFDGLDDPIKDYVAALQATSESADAALGPINEVGEAVGNADFRAAEADLNNYDEALTLTRRSHILVGSAIRQETTPAVEDLTTATDAATQSAEESEAAFDALNTVIATTGDTADDTSDAVGGLGEAGDETARAMGRLEQQIFNVNKEFADNKITAAEAEDQIGLLLDAFDTFGHDGTLAVNDVISAVGTLADVLVEAEGNIGNLGTGLNGLVDLFANPINFAAGTLGNVIEGFAALHEFEGREAGQAGDQTLRPIAEIRLDQEDPRITNTRDLLQQPGGLELLQQGNTLNRPEIRQFIIDEFPEIASQIYSSRGIQGGEGAQNAQQFIAANNIIPGLTPGQDDQERGVVFDPDAVGEAVGDAVMEALAGSEAGVPDPRPDPLGTFSLTRGEREVLAPYQTAVREAENAIEDLTEDSTPQEIADAYQALVFAQTNLSNISEGIIRAAAEAERITGTAATNAITNLGLDLGDDLRTANNSLISTLGDVGFEVVGGIENIREAIDVSDISSAFRRIPEEVEAAAEAEPEPEAVDLIHKRLQESTGFQGQRVVDWAYYEPTLMPLRMRFGYLMRIAQKPRLQRHIPTLRMRNGIYMQRKSVLSKARRESQKKPAKTLLPLPKVCLGENSLMPTRNWYGL